MSPRCTLLPLLGILLLFAAVDCQMQSFRERPRNHTAVLGHLIRIPCKVNNRGGQVQWTRNGFALGFERGIPGYPRYSMTGIETDGDYDLLINGVTIEDDGIFQCQVGPAPGHQPLIGAAYVNVLVPPSPPEIEGYELGAVVQVPHQQANLNLTCVSKHGKPAANITWRRNGGELSSSTIVNNSIITLPNRTETIESTITIIPESVDDNATYTCQAINIAIVHPMMTMVVLNVMHPPGQPIIDGYSTGQIKNAGDTLRLVCTSWGGNPLAQVYWYRNNMEFDFSYVSADGKSVNELYLNVQPTDHGATYRCEATNLVTRQPLVAEVQLTVYFHPASVTVTGHRNATAGQTAMLRCETAISNPPAKITWLARGTQLAGAIEETFPSVRGGFTTVSTIPVMVTDNDDDTTYQCTATVDQLKKSVYKIVTLEVLYPPKDLIITGYTEGDAVRAETVKLIICQCTGGNPLATVTWWKNGVEVTTEDSQVNGNMVRNSLSVHVKAEDNGAMYFCNATNIAAPEPLLANVTLTVNFPPDALNISIEPRYPKVGDHVTITCVSSSSNPPSTLSWLREGDDIEGASVQTRIIPAAYGGFSSISQLHIVPSVQDDDKIYACRASLPGHTVSDAVTLNVSYKPYFPPETTPYLNIVEGSWAVLNITAQANPTVLDYKWYRGEYRLRFGRLPRRTRRDFSMPHFLQEGPAVNITRASRRDAGLFLVEAVNSQGKTNHSIRINVLYGAEVVRTSKDLIVDQGDTAVLECVISANPLTPDMVNWTRTNYNMSRVAIGFRNTISTLTIPNVSKFDSGSFQCSVNNNITNTSYANAELLVKYAPEIDSSPTYGKAAADRGSTASLICKAEGVPDVSFQWYKGNMYINTTQPKYSTVFKKTGLVLYESRLRVYNTTMSDYDTYTCVAANTLGSDRRDIQLDGTSTPDAPYDLLVANVTHNSMLIVWKAGFNGGSFQRFQVRYREIASDNSETRYKYEDVEPSGATMYTIRDLRRNTVYSVAVRGHNRLGFGPFSSVAMEQKTSAVAPLNSDRAPNDIPLITILTVCIVVFVLVGLNIVLILVFVRRRRPRLVLKTDTSDLSSQANSLEMYNPPSTEETRSNATYDRKSIEGFNDNSFYDEKGFYGSSQSPFGGDSYYGSRTKLPPYGSGYIPQDYSGGPQPGGSKEPLYPSDSWRKGQDPYVRGSRTINLGADPGETNDDEDYANQLRKMQQSITQDDIPPFPGPGPRPSVGSTANLQESKSRLYDPPIPTRNYDGSDMPPYMPASGSVTYGRPPPEMRGALV